NPARDRKAVKVPKKNKAKVEPLYESTLTAFLTRARQDRLEAFLVCAVGFGPRRSEALGISLDDVNVWQSGGGWRAGVVIRRNLQRVPIDPLSVPTTTGGHHPTSGGPRTQL